MNTKKLIGWTTGDGSGHEGYNADDYFRNGVYLGPDCHGIEPIFETRPNENLKKCVVCGNQFADAIPATHNTNGTTEATSGRERCNASYATMEEHNYCFTRTVKGWRSVGMVADAAQTWYADHYFRSGRDGSPVAAVAFVPFLWSDNPNVMTEEEITTFAVVRFDRDGGGARKTEASKIHAGV